MKQYPTLRIIAVALLSVALIFTMIPLNTGFAYAEDEETQNAEDITNSVEDVAKPDVQSDVRQDIQGDVSTMGNDIIGGDSSCSHNWVNYNSYNRPYVKCDNTSHQLAYSYCSICGAQKVSGDPQEHNSAGDYRGSTKYDDVSHKQIYHCFYCDADYYELEFHNSYEGAVPYNGTYHRVIWECMDCGYTEKAGLEKHRWDSSSVSCARKATINKKGVLESECKDCYKTMKKSVSWKRGSKYSASYKITYFSNIYRNSKSVTVKLARPAKGAVLKVKIGKKTYKKKIKNNKKKIKVKIKKPKKYAQKFTIKLYYKGKLIGVPDEYLIDDIETFDRVLYGKKIKKGMSKKQVRYLYDWGEPRDTASSSGGYTYWYYWSSKYVIFKNGKVKYWYK